MPVTMALPVSVAITVGCSYLLLPPVDNTKIRLSYGKLGNQNTGDTYAYLEEIVTGQTLNYTLDGTSKLQYSKPSDPKTSYLTWETIATWNIGLDMSFLNNRLTFTGDYYVLTVGNFI